MNENENFVLIQNEQSNIDESKSNSQHLKTINESSHNTLNKNEYGDSKEFVQELEQKHKESQE